MEVSDHKSTHKKLRECLIWYICFYSFMNKIFLLVLNYKNMLATNVNHLEEIGTHSGTPVEIAGTVIANAQDRAKLTWINTPIEQRWDPYRVVAAVHQIRRELMENTLLGPLTFPSGEEIKENRKMQQDFLKNNPEKVALWIEKYREKKKKIASEN